MLLKMKDLNGFLSLFHIPSMVRESIIYCQDLHIFARIRPKVSSDITQSNSNFHGICFYDDIIFYLYFIPSYASLKDIQKLQAMGSTRAHLRINGRTFCISDRKHPKNDTLQSRLQSVLKGRRKDKRGQYMTCHLYGIL